MKEKKALFVFTLLSLFLTLFLYPAKARSQEDQEKAIEWTITKWLFLGPFSNPLPALSEEHRKEYAIEELVEFEQIEFSKLKPKAKKTIKWHDGTLNHWREIQSDKDGIFLLEGDPHPSIAYFGVYLDVRRWTRAKVTIQCSQAFHLSVDGQTHATKLKADKKIENNSSSDGKKVSSDLSLETGKHLVLVKTVYDPNSDAEWSLKGTLSFDDKYTNPSPSLTLSSDQSMTLYHLLDTPLVTGISISPDGNLAAVSLRKSLPPSDDSESWVELYDVTENRLIQTYRGTNSLSGIMWAPTGRKFSYTTRDKSGDTLWIVDLEKGTTVPLLKNIKDLGTHSWSPDGKTIIYSVTEIGKNDKPGVKRFMNLSDRQPWWRNKSYLYKVSVPDGVRERLTAGEFSTSLNSISPNGKKLLFTRSLVDYSERPFEKTELYSLDLLTLKTRLLWEGRWIAQAQWSPDGSKILILGGPSAFGDQGKNITKDVIPNEFDIQAYLFDPDTKNAQPISKDFNPAITQAIWSHNENAIYFLTIRHSSRLLYRYDLGKKEFLHIPAVGIEAIEQFDMAKNKPVAVFTGSGAALPPKAYTLNLQNKKSHILKDPAEEEFVDVEFGKVEHWTFENQTGRIIDGHVYYPPDFNPSQKYPCIVYYYGGTTPVTREFGGRYPKNLWAAQGYVVYVLQPSGAIGYGQEFSALHVNDWGFIVADEIIYGVKQFLAAHPFVDPKKIGCIGASYGGFITMLIQTRTNMFSAAVAHAGISSVASYWGEGYWGYSYSAYAAANSYPWNRKDIFVNQSALFNADKIVTPLLLLHGSEDTNVPPGESTQLFTALKILGREVEYIQILDQDHHIMTYNKRKIWTRTIMAWFDRWLKNQPEWWYSLYPNR
jgi:dipeptidyl aminopeptidase/acylaminoacyl peptidase